MTLSPLHALLLGILQGLTEFLPISSSAHLQLAKRCLGVEGGEELILFDLVCHAGTLTALLSFLRRDVTALFTSDRSKLFLLFLALLPLVPCYWLLKPVRLWASEPHLLGFWLMGTGCILCAGRWLRVAPGGRVRDALCIGVLQSAALIPGISRSASTISAACALGWRPKEAVRFSFLLAIPTILAGTSLEGVKLLAEGEASLSFSSCLIGFVSSCGVGFLVVRRALGWLEKGRFAPCAWYCAALGVAVWWYG
jgi:undecaprenyl-diphosphatase